MSKQKITEQELFAKIAKLQEQMDQAVEEGWWGDNMPELLGGDKAKAPMKVAVTPKNYARVQKMLPAMYTAAKVDPNADEIVKQRYGVYLPPYEKWDGTVPSGRGDFLTRNVFGRDGAAGAEAAGTKAQQVEVERQQRVEANAKKLTDLYGKLKEVLPAAFAKKQDILDPEDRRHADAAVAAAVAGPPPVKESLAESMRRLSSLLSERVVAGQPRVQLTGPEPTDDQMADAEEKQRAALGLPSKKAAAKTAPTAHPAEAVIQEINDTIAAIEADDPDEEDLQLIAAVKGKIEQAQTIIKQEAEAAAKTQSVEAPAAVPAADAVNGKTPEEAMKDPRYQTDPAFRAEVDKAAAFGTAPAAQVKDPAAQADRIANRVDAEAGANTVGTNTASAPPADSIFKKNDGSPAEPPGFVRPPPGVIFNNDPAANAQQMINTTWKKIHDLNRNIIGDNPNLIKPGQKFELPNGMGNYTVAKGDNLTRIAQGRGLGKYDTNVPPQTQAAAAGQRPGGIAFNQDAPLTSTNGPYKNLDVSDPKIRALQAKVANDPNNASFNATVREDQTLARIVSLVNHR